MKTDEQIADEVMGPPLSIEEPGVLRKFVRKGMLEAIRMARNEALVQVRESLTAPLAWNERVRRALAVIDRALDDDSNAKEAGQ